jgi:hypothetical protein
MIKVGKYVFSKDLIGISIYTKVWETKLLNDKIWTNVIAISRWPTKFQTQ